MKQTCTTVISMWCCYYAKVGLLCTLGFEDLPPQVDIIFSSFVLGFGSDKFAKIFGLIIDLDD